MPQSHEVNFDALVGPTHNYAGLAHGNLASQRYGRTVSNPKGAALEGLTKMKLLADLGVPQAVLPPHERPDVGALRRLGFSGSDGDVLEAAFRADPVLLAACASASAMWAANAATVSPSADTADGRVHITPANLISQFHRSLETPTTAAVLRSIFQDPRYFVHHPPLPAALQLSDEGAANHTRLARAHGEPGIELFVYGRRALDVSAPRPQRYPARQTLEASAAIARAHQLNPATVLLAQQNPAVIDAGVFHNDVIAVGNGNVLLCHASPFLHEEQTLAAAREAYRRRCGGELRIIRASSEQLSIEEAVRSYVFNSQLVTLPDGMMSLIAPREAYESEPARRFIDEVIADSANPVRSVHYVDIRQSMCNGGGPACLRLRVVLNEPELVAAHQGVFLTPALYAALEKWVHRHYRDRLVPDDLRDPKLLDESRAALDELTRILGLGPLYPFQRS
jgi:succinylarginine dihydrolase